VRWGWPFGIFAAVAVVHLAGLALAWPERDLTKALLMPALLVAVVIVACWTRRLGRRRAWSGFGLLALGIIASFLGDVLLGPSFEAGLACFAAAHVLYIVAFNGPARARPFRWWSLGYPVALGVLLAVLWPHLGELRPIVIGYGVVLALTAMSATRVNAVTAWGGALFLASDSLLAFRLFQPGFGTAFPDPWQDLAIMVLYCAGQGLIAAGVLRRLGTGRRAPIH